MAGAGYKDFTAGDVLTAAQVDTYLMEQSTMVFASASARDTALSAVKAEGMLAYLSDAPNRLTYYDGSAWNTIWSDWVSFTPSWTNLTLNNGTDTAAYCYVPGGLRVHGWTAFGSTTAMGTGPTMTIPNSETMRAGDSSIVLGNTIMEESGANSYTGVITYISTTAVAFYATNVATFVKLATPTASAPFTWGTGDTISYDFTVALA